MNENTILQDDPRLTAYALGELEGEELAMAAAAVRGDPALRSAVDAIRATARSIETALAAEAADEEQTADGRRQTAEDGGWKSEPVVSTTTADSSVKKSAQRGRLLRFPSLYFVIGGLAAACFAVMVALHEPQPRVFSEQKRYVEVQVTALPTVSESEAAAPIGQDLPTSSTAGASADVAASIQFDPRLEKPAAGIPASASFNTEDHAYMRDNDFIAVAVEPLSTFALDVDTASYANLRRFLERGERPPRDAVRIEELVNYFPYRYTPPAATDAPFAASIEVAAAPWNPQHRLVRIGLKAREIGEAARPATNLKDAALEKLADKGNGIHGYVDSAAETKRLLVEQAGATLVAVAKDVKVQVEFNPAVAGAYRLIGYENRLLRERDFTDDRIGAGEIGAGHTVTALYEVVPVGAAAALRLADTEPLRYQKADGGGRRAEGGRQTAEDGGRKSEVGGQRTEVGGQRAEVRQPGTRNAEPGTLSQELLTVKVRYKEPDGSVSQRLEFPLTDRGTTWADASDDFKFAASVASFGMILRESPYKGTATLAAVAEWARQGLGSDAGGQRNEFLGLVKRAGTMVQ